MSTLNDFRVVGDEWVSLNTGVGLPVGTPIRVSTKSVGPIFLAVSDTQPNLDVSGIVIGNELSYETQKEYGSGVSEVWVKSSSSEVSVEDLTNGTMGGLPNGTINGTRAVNVQFYTESNIKLGLQHEGSTLLLGLAGASSNYTVFITGSLPTVLKARTVSYTGDGITAEIFKAPTYTGGVNAPYQNPNDINPVAGLAQILTVPAVTNEGTLVYAPIHYIGNQSRQGRGATGIAVGGERILAPNTTYLLKLTSLDPSAQDVTSFLSWYEGVLDLPA